MMKFDYSCKGRLVSFPPTYSVGSAYPSATLYTHGTVSHSVKIEGLDEDRYCINNVDNLDKYAFVIISGEKLSFHS